ncbi:MAG: hypothetical protein VYC34_06040 [Planctomycetota bacterium]|nr:hypothetical protein [Planctomycetota bacterium]
MFTKHRAVRGGFVLATAAIVSAAGAAAGTMVFQLEDHPDGNVAPPGYGLRMDSIFHPGAVTTFSFSHPQSNVTLTANDDNPSAITLTIAGVVFGGEKSGGGYGFGEGLYEIEFSYVVGVNTQGTGWNVGMPNVANNGFIRSLGNSDVPAGTTVNFFDAGNDVFRFIQDDHRLENHPAFSNQDFWVGRGWHTMSERGDDAEGQQDWLFIGTLIPSPGAASLAGLGLLGVAGVRRRREA